MKILVTGGTGLVGKNLQRDLPNATYVSSKSFDLTKEHDVEHMFYLYQPTHVIHLASKVGGLSANIQDPVGFYEDNILINTNVLRYAHQYNVDRLVSMLSTCIFPNTIDYPLQPHKIHNGEPHISNFGYAYAKRMLEIQTRAYQSQYNKKWTTIIPTNVYGKFDQFNVQSAHVIPALIHKCYLAKINNTPLHVMGTGQVYREFIYAEDLAKILAWAIVNYENTDPLIVSSPTQHAIVDVVHMIVKEMQFTGQIIFEGDENNNGQLRKPSDTTALQKVHPIQFTPLETGLVDVIQWFMKNYNLQGIRT